MISDNEVFVYEPNNTVNEYEPDEYGLGVEKYKQWESFTNFCSNQSKDWKLIEEYISTYDDIVYDTCYDDRTWKSNIDDIEGGDNFNDYCEEFFAMCEIEEYFE